MPAPDMGQSRLAATNKCLAKINKSRTGGKPTNNRALPVIASCSPDPPDASWASLRLALHTR